MLQSPTLRLLLACALASTTACGGEGDAAPSTAETVATTSSETAATPTPAATTLPGESAPNAAGDPTLEHPVVDLLRANGTIVRASSTTPSGRRGPDKFVDGDLDTAWNSSAEDAAPWFEVTVGPDTELVELAMTAGYTSGGLFTRNRRVAAVRILHEDAEVATHRLDVASRELQVLPVTGRGGVFRVEITETLAGSEATWSETCVSEIRVRGRGPGIEADSAVSPSMWVGTQRLNIGEESVTDVDAALVRLRRMLAQPTNTNSAFLGRLCDATEPAAAGCRKPSGQSPRITGLCDRIRSYDSDIRWNSPTDGVRRYLQRERQDAVNALLAVGQDLATRCPSLPSEVATAFARLGEGYSASASAGPSPSAAD